MAVPVPYEGTVSMAPGTADGPRALVDASRHLDLLDAVGGEPWRVGITALEEPAEIRRMSVESLEAARRARAGDGEARALVERNGEQVVSWVEEVTAALLEGGRVPLVVGGEHAVSAGAFRAAASRHPGLGLLHVDAHADLRDAYEGWRTSHASVMRRALEAGGLGRIVQVGLRDYSAGEQRLARSLPGRITWFEDRWLARRSHEGKPFARTAERIVDELPREVWISFDVDGLDPGLCPGTGTPVPGGLTWREAVEVLASLARTGRVLVGADVVEIGPGRWDGLVAAKLLYLIAGLAAGSKTP